MTERVEGQSVAVAACCYLAGAAFGRPWTAWACVLAGTAQAVALLGFGGVAVAAVLVSPRLGLGLAGVVLASHAVWDFRHLRRNDVVPRSLAEFCIALDIPFGIAAIVLAGTS